MAFRDLMNFKMVLKQLKTTLGRF